MYPFAVTYRFERCRVVTVLLRADSNKLIGSGHVMRCAGLGLQLLLCGKSVHLVAAEISDSLVTWLKESGIGFSRLPMECINNSELDSHYTLLVAENLGDVNVVVVDHYGLDGEWETVLRTNKRRIMVIDDLANRRHNCDILLDTGLHSNQTDRYLGLVSKSTLLFLGPEYLLLRPEFNDISLLRNRTGEISKVLVYFGDGLMTDEIRKVSSALACSQLSDLETTIVLGRTETSRELIDEIFRLHPAIHTIFSSNDFALLMQEADLAIGTCGISAWERCVLGLPAITVVAADNQFDDAIHLDRLGAIKNLGRMSEVSEKMWKNAIIELVSDPVKVASMSRAGQSAVFNRGKSQFLLDEILNNGI